MGETKLCCNCLHCARWKRKDGIETHCDLNDKYLGYLDVMDEDNDCKHWEKETKWDLQREHDAKVRADAKAEVIDEILKYYECSFGGLVVPVRKIKQIKAEIMEQLTSMRAEGVCEEYFKEQKYDSDRTD